MTIPLRAVALSLATILATAGPALAADPAGSTPSTRMPAPPPVQALPLPGRTPGPTGQDLRPLAPPQAPGGLSASDDAALDAMLGVFGAVSFGAPAGACDGLIPCCNTTLDAQCEFVTFDIACVDAGGSIHIDVQPDGSETYSCPIP